MVVDFYNEVLTNIISILSLNMLAKIIHNPFVADGRKAFMDF